MKLKTKLLNFTQTKIINALNSSVCFFYPSAQVKVVENKYWLFVYMDFATFKEVSKSPHF